MIDGDTLQIHGQRIRLHGIDAPESRQPCRLDGKPWPCGRDAADILTLSPADLWQARLAVKNLRPGQREAIVAAAEV